MDLKISGGKLSGVIAVPQSKSYLHRALICAYLSGRPLTVNNPCTDVELTAAALASLYDEKPRIYCGDSGSTLRFMLPLAAALGKPSTFICSERLAVRPIKPLIDAMNGKGVTFTRPDDVDDGIVVTNGKLVAGDFFIDSKISTQFVSGLLMALPLLDGDSTLITTFESPYIDITLQVLADSGVSVEKYGLNYRIKGGGTFDYPNRAIEGDYSAAAMWMVANALGCDIELEGLNADSAQGDKIICELLDGEILKQEFPAVNCRRFPDLAPILAVYLAAKGKKCTLSGLNTLHHKECDRVLATAHNLSNMGINVKSGTGYLKLLGGKLKAGRIEGFNDHRIVMAFAIAAACVKGDSYISGAEAVAKSYPSFWEDFRKVGGKAVDDNRQ